MKVFEGAIVEEIALPATIVKRDGRIVQFDPTCIAHALRRCFSSLGQAPGTPIPELVVRVINILSAHCWQPTAVMVQDAVELTLQGAGEFDASCAFICDRSQRDGMKGGSVPQVADLVAPQ